MAQRHGLMPVRIPLKPSRVLMALMMAAGGVSVLSVMLLPVAIGIRLGLGLWVCVSVWHVLRRYAWLGHADSIIALEVDAAGMLHCRMGETWQPVTVLPHSVVLPHLMVLNLRVAASGHLFRVLLLPDSADMDDLRRLRVWLRWGLPEPVSSHFPK